VRSGEREKEKKRSEDRGKNSERKEWLRGLLMLLLLVLGYATGAEI
jgi:hypothetical protein